MSARSFIARVLPAGAMAASATALAAGWAGDDVRWLGVLGLSEVVVVGGLRWSGLLRRRPWARLGLRLAAAAAALTAAGRHLPSAEAVAFLFAATGLVGLAWGAARWKLSGDRERPRLRPQLEAMSVVASVGLWFASVPLPPSGWSPLVGVLVATTALGPARPPSPLGPEQES